MKFSISIVTPTFNEEECIEELIVEVSKIMLSLQHDYEHIIIDNCSTDKTVDYVKKKCSEDFRVKLIVNSQNFGQVISPVAGLFEAKGDAVIILAADFENPPEVIPLMIDKWRDTGLPVFGTIQESNESKIMQIIRSGFYQIIARLSAERNVPNFNGYCLVPRQMIERLRRANTLYLFLRNELVKHSVGYETVAYEKQKRVSGISKNNFFSLLHIAMVGFIANNINLCSLVFKSAVVFNGVLGILIFALGSGHASILPAALVFNSILILLNQYYLSELAIYKKNQRESTLAYHIKERCNFD